MLAIQKNWYIYRELVLADTPNNQFSIKYFDIEKEKKYVKGRNFNMTRKKSYLRIHLNEQPQDA